MFGSLVIIALVVLAMVMFVKTCSIMSCMCEPDNETGLQHDVESGSEQ